MKYIGLILITFFAIGCASTHTDKKTTRATASGGFCKAGFVSFEDPNPSGDTLDAMTSGPKSAKMIVCVEDGIIKGFYGSFPECEAACN